MRSPMLEPPLPSGSLLFGPDPLLLSLEPAFSPTDSALNALDQLAILKLGEEMGPDR